MQIYSWGDWKKTTAERSRKCRSQTSTLSQIYWWYVHYLGPISAPLKSPNNILSCFLHWINKSVSAFGTQLGLLSCLDFPDGDDATEPGMIICCVGKDADWKSVAVLVTTYLLGRRVLCLGRHILGVFERSTHQICWLGQNATQNLRILTTKNRHLQKSLEVQILL